MTKKINDKIKKRIIELRRKDSRYSAKQIHKTMNEDGDKVSEATIKRVLRDNGEKKLSRRTNRELTQNTLPKENIPLVDLSSKYILIFFLLFHFVTKTEIVKTLEQTLPSTLKKLDLIRIFLTSLTYRILDNFRYSQRIELINNPYLPLLSGTKKFPEKEELSSLFMKTDTGLFYKVLNAIISKYAQMLKTPVVDIYFSPQFYEQEVNRGSEKSKGRIPDYISVLVIERSSGMQVFSNSEDEFESRSDAICGFTDTLNQHGETDEYILVFTRRGIYYKELDNLNKNGSTFLTFRAFSAAEVAKAKSSKRGKDLTIIDNAGKHRSVTVYDESTTLNNYEGKIRQIIITGHRDGKATLLISNDFKRSTSEIIDIFAKRWLPVEDTRPKTANFFNINEPEKYLEKILNQVQHNFFSYLVTYLPELKNCGTKKATQELTKTNVKVSIKAGMISVLVENTDLRQRLSAIPGLYEITEIPWMKGMSVQFVNPEN